MTATCTLLGRASELGLFDWGTYAYGSLTLDDIAGAQQCTDCGAARGDGANSISSIGQGTINLEVKFANGKVKQPANNL